MQPLQIGVLVPAGNPTVEPELYRMAPPGVSIHFARFDPGDDTSEPGGAETKAYLGAVIAALMLILVPVYSKLVNRYIRSTLVTAVTLFFIGCLVAFWLMNKAHVPHLAYAFFVWIAIFNVMVVAQFWGFANDVYDGDAGRRLFPIVAFGANLGAVLGPRIHTAMLD